MNFKGLKKLGMKKEGSIIIGLIFEPSKKKPLKKIAMNLEPMKKKPSFLKPMKIKPSFLKPSKIEPSFIEGLATDLR